MQLTLSPTVQRGYTVLAIMLLLISVVDAQQPRSKRSTDSSQAQAFDPVILAAQVALDRSGFSPGEIDGQGGAKTRLAITAFQNTNKLPPSGIPDEATLAALHVGQEPIINYTITPEDVAGPFTESVPKDMMDAAKLPALGYANPVEALAERFHSSQAFLRRLNPDVSWKAGDVIKVPDVEPFEVPSKPPAPEKAAARGEKPQTSAGATGTSGAANNPVEVVISGATKSLIVRDSTGHVLMHAPVTTGSEHDPLPIGDWKVTGVSWNPTFNYNPDLFWDANPSHSKAKIPPGPNNPVGVVWVDINKEHFGLHGTPEPSAIGRSESHGCVRLTNWDATKLARLVTPGTKVTIR
jgi:lipoprotein-anchoring transpeptidase ErfK/SrfK